MVGVTRFGATDTDGETQCGATDTDGVTRCGATDADGETSITRVSDVLAYLKLKGGKNEILTIVMEIRKTNPLIYVKIVFLDRVPLSDPTCFSLLKITPMSGNMQFMKYKTLNIFTDRKLTNATMI